MRYRIPPLVTACLAAAVLAAPAAHADISTSSTLEAHLPATSSSIGARAVDVHQGQPLTISGPTKTTTCSTTLVAPRFAYTARHCAPDQGADVTDLQGNHVGRIAATGGQNVDASRIALDETTRPVDARRAADPTGLAVGTAVTKTGATTGTTGGELIDGGVMHGKTGFMRADYDSAGGDSGAPVFGPDGAVVGVHFGRAGGKAWFTPIDRVVGEVGGPVGGPGGAVGDGSAALGSVLSGSSQLASAVGSSVPDISSVGSSK